MERLTSRNELPINDNDIHNKQLRKLQLLEDIEEELGCPLQALLRALKDGI